MLLLCGSEFDDLVSGNLFLLSRLAQAFSGPMSTSLIPWN